MHTKDVLATELRKAGLDAMADKAAEGYYHDFLSPLVFPEMQLLEDLDIGTPAAIALRERVVNGEFDASAEESAEWSQSPEAQQMFRMMFQREE